MSAPQEKKIKILIVEDDEGFRQALKILLTRHKYEVTECVDGKEAKSLVSLNSFDVILSDVRMPHVYGTELLQYVRKNSQTPFILMTGFSDILEATEAYKIGANGFIAKPFKSEEMIEILQKVLPPPPGAPAPAENPTTGEKYCRLHIDDFLGGKSLSTDLYIEIGKDKFIKIAHKGAEVLSEQVKAYKAKNVHYLYILEKDFSHYVDVNLKLSNFVFTNSKVSSELKSKVLRLTQESILQDLYLVGLDKNKFNNAAAVTTLMVSTVANNENILNLINDLNTQSDYLYAHSVGVSTYSVLIAQEIGWTSSIVLFKLGLAGLLHDIGKKEIPRDILEKPRAQMTAADMKLLESHSFRGRSILESVHEIPADILTIVLQHHENMYGQGPLGLEEKNIHPLAKVVALANRFCEITIKNPSRTVFPPLQALERLKSLGSDEFDKEAFAALERLVLNKPEAKTA